MSKATTTINLSLRVRVLCPQDLVREARERTRSAVKPSSVIDALKVLCVAPDKASVSCGYEVLSIECEREDGSENEYALSVTAQIHDDVRLKAEAAEAYSDVWQEEIAFESSERAVYELILASNSAPSPVDLGFEILRDKVAAPQPSATAAPV